MLNATPSFRITQKEQRRDLRRFCGFHAAANTEGSVLDTVKYFDTLNGTMEVWTLACFGYFGLGGSWHRSAETNPRTAAWLASLG